MPDIPEIQKRNVGFRSRIVSKEQNNFQEEVYRDLLNLYIKANKLDDAINSIKDNSAIENLYLVKTIKDIKTLYETNASNATYSIYPNMITKKDNTLNAISDTDYMCVTSPALSSQSRVSLPDDILNEVFLPQSLKVNLTPEEGTYGDYTVEDSNVYEPFKSKGTYWMRKITGGDTLLEANSEMVIELPDEYISSREINCIMLNPFPFKGLDIIGIYYTLYGDWTLIPSFGEHKNAESETYTENGQTKTRQVIKNAETLRFDFEAVRANKIKIKFRQRNSIDYNNQKTFCFGLKDIKILYNEYNLERSYFEFKIDFKKQVTIKNIKEVLNNISQSEQNSISYEFYYLTSDGTEIRINSVTPFLVPSNVLLVKGYLNCSGKTANINKFELSYE